MSDGPLGKAPESMLANRLARWLDIEKMPASGMLDSASQIATDVSGLANRRGSLNCWMNASVQSLANVTQLQTAVVHARSASGGRPTLLGELQLAFTAMRCRGVFELVTLRNLLGECVMARACSRTLLLNVCVPNG
jgi:hypothetical protein